MNCKQKNKKKVLFLCQYFYPEYISSATLPFDTALALVNVGYKVSVICGYPYEYYHGPKVEFNEIYNGLSIKRLKYLHVDRKKIIGRIINFLSFLSKVFLNFNQLKKHDLIFVYSNPPILPVVASLSAKLFKNKFIFVCYDVYPEIAVKSNKIKYNGLVDKSMKWINTKVYNNVSKIVVLSREMKDFLISNRMIMDDEKIVTIPNWHNKKKSVISTNNIELLKLKKPDLLIVSYFGNLGICQDLTTILDSIRSIKFNIKIKFLFAGHGVKYPELKRVVTEERLTNVIVFDFLHGDDFNYALEISDCFLVSLAQGIEGLAVPSKTYSYYAAGKPVISIMDEDTDISKELLENNAGFHVDLFDSNKLLEIIQYLSENKDTAKLMGLNALKLFNEKYTKKVNTDKYISLVNNELRSTDVYK